MITIETSYNSYEKLIVLSQKKVQKNFFKKLI